METINTKAMRGISTFLTRRGFEILEEGWAHGKDRAWTRMCPGWCN